MEGKNRRSEKDSNLPEVTQQVSGRARTKMLLSRVFPLQFDNAQHLWGVFLCLEVF